MSTLSLSYYESHVTVTNISQSLPHIMAGKQLAYIWYEEITSLSPYVFTCGCRPISNKFSEYFALIYMLTGKAHYLQYR